jgi:hypothetical protein
MSLAVYKEIQVPMGIECAIQCYFLSEKELNLVVTKATVLQIFVVRKTQERVSLDLCMEKKMFGRIESISSVRYPGRKLESLLLTFKDAKVRF